MNLLNRIKNLWKLSEFMPNVNNGKVNSLQETVTTIVKPKVDGKVQIIKRKAKDPIEEIVNSK